ncbi:hypothetical protein EG872_16445, partial [Enterococcus faecalis]
RGGHKVPGRSALRQRGQDGLEERRDGARRLRVGAGAVLHQKVLQVPEEELGEALQQPGAPGEQAPARARDHVLLELVGVGLQRAQVERDQLQLPHGEAHGLAGARAVLARRP